MSFLSSIVKANLCTLCPPGLIASPTPTSQLVLPSPAYYGLTIFKSLAVPYDTFHTFPVHPRIIAACAQCSLNFLKLVLPIANGLN